MKRSYLKRRTPLRAKTSLKRSQKPQNRSGGKKRTRTTSSLKKKLDAVFSKYIRAKYPPVCYTCGKKSDRLQCGHFVSRQYLATRWEEDNCRPQCVGCNIWGRGQTLDFEEHLVIDLGLARVEELKYSRHQIIKLSPSWYEEQIDFYSKELDTLENV